MRRLIFVVVVALIATGAFFAYRVNNSRAADDLGSTQPLALGTAIAIDPNLDAPAAAFSVAAGASLRGRITVRTLKPDGINRPTNGGRVALVVTATLDARQSVAIDGRRTRRLVVPVETPNRHDLPFVLPPLDPGHHCLSVAVLEDPRTVYEGRDAIDHRSIFAVDIAAGPGPDHCRATTHADGPVNDDLPVGCDLPVITPDPSRVPNGGRFKPGRMWALVPSCHGAASVSIVLHHDGQIVTQGRLAPFTAPNDGHNRVIDVGVLPRGTWRMAVIASGEHSVSHVGPPVLVD